MFDSQNGVSIANAVLLLELAKSRPERTIAQSTPDVISQELAYCAKITDIYENARKEATYYDKWVDCDDKLVDDILDICKGYLRQLRAT
jgi:hypothetical protein